MEQENRDWEKAGMRSILLQDKGIIILVEAMTAESKPHETPIRDAILADHRGAAVAREALEEIADEYSSHWDEDGWVFAEWAHERAKAALRSLTEGDQAAGEEKKGSGE